MKKIIFIILICWFMALGITGCSNNKQELDNKAIEEYETDDKTTEEYYKEIIQCLESQLGGYLADETNDLIDIPLSEISNVDNEEIAYYKGVYASNNPDNKYVILKLKNGSYNYMIMKDFDKYFYEKFFVYQYYTSSKTPTVYIHTSNNDVDFETIVNKCVPRNSTQEGKTIPSKTLNKLSNTTKIVIKSGKKELGTIKDKSKLSEILNAISGSKKYGEVCLADGHSFDFEMYDNNNKLIDTIYVWGDGRRLLPKSMSGCYYSSSSDSDLRKIIEEETDYVFYILLPFISREDKQRLIYEDEKYSYYINGKNANEVLIKFMLNSQTMTLKYALENKYISAEKVASEYPDILIKK